MNKRDSYMEEILEWAEAFEIPIRKTFEREELANYLHGKLTAATVEGEERQVSAIWRATQMKWDSIMPHGIVPFTINFKTGKQLRFAIKGFRGAFGISGILRNTGFDLESEWESFR